MTDFELIKILSNMTMAINWSIESNLHSILDHILHFWDKLEQNRSKITQPRGQNENLTFLGQNISLQGKYTKNSEFQYPSSKKWFLVLYSNKKLVFEFFGIGSRRRGF